jgi:hypothetical protein
MDELYFKKAVTKTAVSRETPIAMRSGSHSTNRMYLIGSPPVWYSPPLTKKDPITREVQDDTEEKAWQDTFKVALTTQDLGKTSRIVHYVRFYVKVNDPLVDPYHGTTDTWATDRIIRSTYPEIPKKLRKPNPKALPRSEQYEEAQDEEVGEAVEEDFVPDPKEDNVSPHARPDTTQSSSRQATATPNTNAEMKTEDNLVQSCNNDAGSPHPLHRTVKSIAKNLQSLHTEVKEVQDETTIQGSQDIGNVPRPTAHLPAREVSAPPSKPVPNSKKEDNAKEQKQAVDEVEIVEHTAFKRCGPKDTHVDDLNNRLACYPCSEEVGHRSPCLRGGKFDVVIERSKDLPPRLW